MSQTMEFTADAENCDTAGAPCPMVIYAESTRPLMLGSVASAGRVSRCVVSWATVPSYQRCTTRSTVPASFGEIKAAVRWLIPTAVPAPVDGVIFDSRQQVQSAEAALELVFVQAAVHIEEQTFAQSIIAVEGVRVPVGIEPGQGVDAAGDGARVIGGLQRLAGAGPFGDGCQEIRGSFVNPVIVAAPVVVGNLVGNHVPGKIGCLAAIVNVELGPDGDVRSKVGAGGGAHDRVFEKDSYVIGGQWLVHEGFDLSHRMLQQVHAAVSARRGADDNEVGLTRQRQVDDAFLQGNAVGVQEYVNESRIRSIRTGKEGNDFGPVIGNATTQR